MPAPTDLARHATMRRIASADAHARYTRARRRDAASNGYRGPLTRAEATDRALRRLAAR